MTFPSIILHQAMIVFMKDHALPSIQHLRRRKLKGYQKGEQMQAAPLISGCATFPVCGTLTNRPKFHKQPVSVPPPSTASIHVVEYSYGKQ